MLGCYTRCARLGCVILGYDRGSSPDGDTDLMNGGAEGGEGAVGVADAVLTERDGGLTPLTQVGPQVAERTYTNTHTWHTGDKRCVTVQYTVKYKVGQ